MISDSYAMSVYGEIRTTRDIDVVIELQREDVARFAHAFRDDYYVSDDSIRSAISRRSMFNLISHQHGGKIDCIIGKDTDFARESFRGRIRANIADVIVWVTTKEDLIIAKLNWARDTHSGTQIRDIASLTDSDYDAEYVEHWIDSLGLQNIWSKVLNGRHNERKSKISLRDRDV
ncbi:hypothetical protein [Leptolyngbya sp. 7M]|uniref:hypothetical protein n=1 Tax=Leptolyngbya sp. 7M TaxID=2812896 RepID=UPI001B8C4596|nr:hypothetical protein [Leptolyngbya sp. 7M]QYO65701.1 hypothetical protein JVX88_02615 [Leptolyngbya sp. 7M]